MQPEINHGLFVYNCCIKVVLRCLVIFSQIWQYDINSIRKRVSNPVASWHKNGEDLERFASTDIYQFRLINIKVLYSWLDSVGEDTSLIS